MTPINIWVLKEIVRNYPDQEMAQFLITGFQEGFHIPFKGPWESFDCENLPLALNNLSAIRAMILKEVQEGTLKGPFDQEPMPNTWVSPLGLVPKKDENGKITGRKIIHLSYLRTGMSINSEIDPEEAKVEYQSFDQAAEMCDGLPVGSYLTKADMKSAFRQLLIHPIRQAVVFGYVHAIWVSNCL